MKFAHRLTGSVALVSLVVVSSLARADESFIPSSQSTGQMSLGKSAGELEQRSAAASFKVASLNEIQTLSSVSVPVSEPETPVITIYDGAGRPVHEKRFNGQNVLVQQTYWAYDLSGALRTKSIYDYDDSGIFQKRTDMYMDALGRVILEKESDAKGKNKKAVYRTYQPDGSLQKTVTVDFEYGSTGRLVRKTSASRDGNGQLFEKIHTNGMGQLVKKEIYGADPTGASDGILLQTLEYDPQTGMMTKTVEYSYRPGTNLLAYSVVRSAAGALVEESYYGVTGVVSRKIEYGSDEKMVRVTVYDPVTNAAVVYDQSLIATGESLAAWFQAGQQATLTGLIVSHPDETGFIYHEGNIADWAIIRANTQAYTYDQALAGITLLKSGDLQGAQTLFNFFYSEYQNASPNFTGFWTVYNVDPFFQWKRYEWRKGLGENAWMAFFALHYAETATDPVEKAKGIELASAIARWIAALPHYQGGVAMSPDNPSGNPNFGRIYSVENNLDYYALLKALIPLTPAGAEKDTLQSEFANLKNWFMTQAYDASEGIFRTGGYLKETGEFQWDINKSLDVNSWAVQAIGVETLVNDFGIDPDNLMQIVANTFAVQEDNTFGGDIFTAKGFDFSDAGNAARIGRTGMKWVEGTNQMILSYRLIADYYASIGDVSKAAYYRRLARYFESRNPENVIPVGVSLSYVYADVPNVQIFNGTTTWRTFPGQAAPSGAWVYFALTRLNPFNF